MIDIKTLKGKIYPKLQESSMFPRNWSLQRIQQEIAYIYENTFVKEVGQIPRKPTDAFSKFEFLDSNNKFKILIEIDDFGNIMNAYPNL